jgi:hypothetical protein
VRKIDCILHANGSVNARCDDCGVEWAIDTQRPFVRQLKNLAEMHRCSAAESPAPRGRLALVPPPGVASTGLVEISG